MHSNELNFFAIDAGGSRLRGFSSVSKKEYEGSGVSHTNTLALDLAKNIVAFMPKEISDTDLIVLSLAAIFLGI